MTEEELFDYIDSHDYRLLGSEIVNLCNKCPQIINDEYDPRTHICTFETTNGSHYSVEVLIKRYE